MNFRILTAVCLTSAAIVFGLPSAQAQYDNFKVSIDTSGFPALTGGDTYNIYFQLVGSAGSSVSLNTFNLGGGTVGGSPTLLNSASGSIGAGTISLGATSASNFTNSYADVLNPGTGTLSFDAHLSPISASTPDSFAFGIGDTATPSQFSTSGPTGYEFATIDLTKTSFATSDWNVYSYTSGAGGNVFASVSPLTSGTNVPETDSPAGFGILAAAGLVRAGIQTRRKSAK